MKRIFVWALSILLIIPSCLKFTEPTNRSIQLVLTANGFNSAAGDIYIQRFVWASLEVLTPDSLTVTSANWKIEKSVYQGKQIVHKFNTLGEVYLSVEVTFSNGIKVTRNFTVKVIDDLSEVDPVIIIPLNRVNNKTEILFLFSRERLRYAKDTILHYVGNLTEWKNVRATYQSYVLDETGKPIVTKDVGKYVGFKLSLADDQYEMALVYSDSIWTNFSGSKYVSPENLGRIKFSLQSMEVIPLGDGNVPGILGDGYFRFSLKKLEVEVYFRLDEIYTSNSFYCYQTIEGKFSDPISLTAVTGYEYWGKAIIPEAKYLGRVITFRFGPDKNQPNSYSKNMERSFYYSLFSKGIEIQFQKL